MKILSRGIKPEDKIFRGTCQNCKTEFECLRHEGTYFNGTQRDDAFLRVTCPVCGQSAHAYELKQLGGSLNRYQRPTTWDEKTMARQMTDFAGQDER